MQVLALGFNRMAGKAKESGKDYDMAQLYIVLPLTGFQNANMQRTSVGFKTAEMEVSPDAWGQFASVQYPQHLELTIKEEMREGKGNKVDVRRVIVGIAKQRGLVDIRTADEKQQAVKPAGVEQGAKVPV